eukprot:64542_1
MMPINLSIRDHTLRGPAFLGKESIWDALIMPFSPHNSIQPPFPTIYKDGKGGCIELCGENGIINASQMDSLPKKAGSRRIWSRIERFYKPNAMAIHRIGEKLP